MIQFNELRIGNLVHVGNGIYERVLEILCDSITTETKHSIFDFEGIPLTPEILEKAGFWYVSFKDGHLYYCHPKTGFTLLNAYGKWNYSTSKSITQGRQIEYFHQLQNFYFAITGEELQIEL